MYIVSTNHSLFRLYRCIDAGQKTIMGSETWGNCEFEYKVGVMKAPLWTTRRFLNYEGWHGGLRIPYKALGQ